LIKLWSENANLFALNSVEAFAMTMTKNYCLDQLKSKRAGNIKTSNDNFTDKLPSLDKIIEDVDSLK
jgi:RNA polymerase sigma-70 factor (ECF subfamily)